MPPLPLTTVLQTVLPGRSRVGRAVINTLACENGVAPAANEIAVSVGLRDRHQLARRLRHDGLPPLERLAAWTRVLYWMLEARSTNASLRQLVRRDQLDPATAYRLVRRVTGQRWSDARRAGLSGALLRFRNQCVAPTVVAVRAGRSRSGAEDCAPRASARYAAPGHPDAVLTARLPLSGGPFDVAIAPCGIACVTRGRAAAVDCLELSPLRVVGSIGTGAAPTRVVVNPSGEEAYVTNQFTEDVTIVDLPRCRPSGAVIVPGHPRGAVLSPDARTLYVATNLDWLCAISVRARRVVASVPVRLACRGSGLAIHPSGRWLYVPAGTAGLILEVDTGTLEPRRRFAVGGVAHDLSMSADGALLYCGNRRGCLDVIQLSTGRVVSVPLDAPAFGVALSPDEAVVYVGLPAAGRVVHVDRSTLRVLGSLEPGGRPRRIAFDPTGHWALIANEAGWVDRVG